MYQFFKAAALSGLFWSLSSKRASPCLPEGKQSKTGFQKSNQNGISIIRL